jgi:hypothetical protein
LFKQAQCGCSAEPAPGAKDATTALPPSSNGRQTGGIVADYGRRVLLPTDKFQSFQPPAPSIPPSPGHHREWLDACKTGSPTLCNFDYGGRLVENLLLSIVACRVQKKLEWDPVNLKATNCPEADQYIRKPYRKGWELTT